MKRLAWPALAGLLGLIVTVMLHSRVNPVARFQCMVGREGAIEQARREAKALGFDTGGWTAAVVLNVQRRLEIHAAEHPADPVFRLLWPARLSVVLVKPDKSRALTVDLSCRGRTVGWRTGKLENPPARDAVAEKRAAEAAMRGLTGEYAGEFQLITDGAPVPEGSSYSWESTWNGVRATVKAMTRGNQVVESHLEADSRSLPDVNSSPVTGSTSVLLFIAGMLASLVFYTIGLISKNLDHRFALKLAICAALLSLLAQFGGSSFAEALQPERGSDPVSTGSIWISLGMPALGVFAGSLIVSAAGLFGARKATPKWSTLRLLISAAPARNAGISLAAGLLVSPIILAINDAMLATGLFGTATAGKGSLDDLYGAFPAGSLADDVLGPVFLGLMGILVTPMWARISRPALRWSLAILICGLALSSGASGGSTARELLTGLLQAVVLVMLYAHFDILAALALQFGLYFSMLFWTGWIQPGSELRHGASMGLTVFAAVLALSLWMAYRGREVTAETQAMPIKGLLSGRERLQAEFSVARRAQQQMLPATAPHIAGFDLCASCTPAREVAGDLYDFLPLDGGLWGITVADVSGKGVPAALYMTLTKGLLKSTTEWTSNPVQILRDINSSLHEAAQRKVFVTMVLAVLDPRARTLDLARAGHNPSVWHSPMRGETVLLNPAGIGLGLASPKLFDGKIEVRRLNLMPGDTLVFYSDGLTEAMNEPLEEFGEKRLMAAVRETEGMLAEEAHAHILSRVNAFLAGVSPQDDLTLVVLKVTGALPDEETPHVEAELEPEPDLVGFA